MEWDEAIAKFNESMKIERICVGKTTPSEVYIQRCRTFKENPPVAPGEKWDGVFRLTKK
jgi:adenylate cyclase